jgi:tRNA pseudouridine38-40 synthase
MNDREKVQRYRVDLAFHGARFHGWQRQPGLCTVQGELETWLSRMLPGDDPVAVTGAGRTDAGVHAEHMVAHFDSAPVPDPAQLAARLSAALPADIVIHKIAPVAGDFHARYSAATRTYVYRIDTRSTPFGRDRSWRIPKTFDLPIAQVAAERVLGLHDFAGFCRAGSRRESMACVVHRSLWDQTTDGFAYHIKANRFLHGMVRLLVGTMVEISWGRWPVTRMDEILEKKDVRLCGTVAPPHGLTLARIEYFGDAGHLDFN